MDGTQRNITTGNRVITGATGAGKTCLLSACLQRAATMTERVTIEDCPAITLKPGFPLKDTTWPKS